MLQAAHLPLDRLFRAFADPTRLRILHLLQDGEMCVCDLVADLAVPQPTASRHLAYLRKANLVQVRTSGSWKYYALAAPATSFHAKLLDCLKTCFADVPTLSRDTARKGKKRKASACCD